MIDSPSWNCHQLVPGNPNRVRPSRCIQQELPSRTGTRWPHQHSAMFSAIEDAYGPRSGTVRTRLPQLLLVPRVKSASDRKRLHRIFGVLLAALDLLDVVSPSVRMVARSHHLFSTNLRPGSFLRPSSFALSSDFPA